MVRLWVTEQQAALSDKFEIKVNQAATTCWITNFGPTLA